MNAIAPLPGFEAVAPVPSVKVGRGQPAKVARPIVLLCQRYMAQEGISRAELAARAGVHRSQLERLFNSEGGTMVRAGFKGLAAVLGITLEAAIVAAGGETAEERRVRVGRQLQERHPWTPETAQRGGRGNQGRKIAPDVVAQSMATRRNNGGLDRATKALTAYSRSAQGQALHSLFGRLNGVAEPTKPQRGWKPQLRRWAKAIGTEVGLSTDTVLALWEPHLKRRKLWRDGGRKPDEGRHLTINECLATFEKRPAGHYPRGTWGEVATAVSAAEKLDPPLTDRYVQKWLQRHLLEGCELDR